MNSMAAGTITRHFEHPSGATASLEMPAGWSRNCWYEVRATSAEGVSKAPDRKTFNSPEEARQAAVAHEREALASGWIPRILMPAAKNPQRREWKFYRPSGEEIPLRVTAIEEMIESRQIRAECRGDHTSPIMPIARDKRIRFSCHGQFPLDPGDRFLLRQSDVSPITIAPSITIAAFIVQSKITSFAPYEPEPTTIDVQAAMTALEPGETEAIERWHDREAIIQAGIENDADLVTIWGWLGTRITDTGERQQVQAAIIRGRNERQARLQREERDRQERENQEAYDRREQARRAVEAQSRPIIRVTAEREQQRQKQTDEALRKLSGGVDLTKQHKRKIDLGD